jgi:hypothetical protein
MVAVTCWVVPTVTVIMGSLAAGAELCNVGLCRRLSGAQPSADVNN